MSKKYFFISDVHLGLHSKEIEYEKETKLVEFLHSIKSEAEALFITGDLFDYWFEYRRVYQKGFFRTLTALHELVKSGTTVYYLIGNHDFFHRDFFSKEIGVRLIQDSITTVIDGKKFFMAHGDGYVKNDLGYRILKRVLRNKILQWFYSLIHPDLGILLASGTSKRSRDYTEKKDYGKEDGLLETAKNYIDNGYDYVVFGHSHIRAVTPVKHGYYVNLGSWLQGPCYGKFENNSFEIVNR